MAPIVFWFGNLCFPRSVLSGTTDDFTPYTSEPTKKYFFTCIITRKKQGSGSRLELCLFTDARHEIPPYIHFFFLFLCRNNLSLQPLQPKSLPSFQNNTLQSAVCSASQGWEDTSYQKECAESVNCTLRFQFLSFFTHGHARTHTRTRM